MFYIRFGGRVPFEVSSDVEFVVVCMGECFLDLLWGNRFLQCKDAKDLFCVCCCLASKSRPCDAIDAKNEVYGVIKDYPFLFLSST